jgi:hypothetical protein
MLVAKSVVKDDTYAALSEKTSMSRLLLHCLMAWQVAQKCTLCTIAMCPRCGRQHAAWRGLV